MSMTFEDYHARDEFGSTTMRRMVDSPEEFKFGVMTVKQDTLRKGTNLHSATLERDLFDRMTVFPDLNFRGASNKESAIAWAETQFNVECLIDVSASADDLRDEFVAMASRVGGSLVYQKDRELALDMSASVYHNPEAADLLDGALCEQSYFHGQFKTRPDITNTGRLADLKQDKDPSQNRFQSSAWDKRYGFLLAHSESVLAPNGIPIDSWHWIVVAPKHHLIIDRRNIHQVEVYQADADLMARSRQQFADAVGLLLECQASGNWPGPPTPDQPRMIGMPCWVDSTNEE